MNTRDSAQIITHDNEWLPRRNEMMREYQEDYQSSGNTITGVLVGVLGGGLAGALTMLLLAPQTGKETRRQLREKGINLRDRASEAVEDTFAQVRTNANRVSTDIKTYSQKLVAQQL